MDVPWNPSESLSRGCIVTLPIGSIVLASGAVDWMPVEDVEYQTISILHDPERGLTRIILEGTDLQGDEVRSVLYFDAQLNGWEASDYERHHGVLTPIGLIDETIEDEEDES